MAQYSKRQLEPIIKKYGINPTCDEVFNTIIELFDGQTPYHIWAIKSVYGNITTLDNIKRLKVFSDENQTLISKLSKQNLISYNTKEDFKQLNDEIDGILKIALVKRNIEHFNTTQRNMLKNAILMNAGNEVTPLYASRSSKFNKFFNLFKKFETLNDSRRHKLIVSASAVNDDFSFLINMIKDSLNSSYDWNKEDLLGFIKRNDLCKGVKVVHDNGNILVLEIPNFNASRTICGNGRTTWCLTREESYFNQYAGKSDCRQYFYFDFSKPERDELAHVGFTVNATKGITYAHSTNNNSLIGSGIRYNGDVLNIDKVLGNAHISKRVFIHLNELKNYKWDFNNIMEFIAKNGAELPICVNKNGFIVVKALSKNAYSKLCGHTLNDVSSIFNSSDIYIIINTNIDVNDDTSIVSACFAKDKYGILSLNRVVDAYNVDITKNSYFDKIDIPVSSFVNREDIKPEILLHKLIEEGNENEVLKLLSDTKGEFDVNYEFNENCPIFSVIERKMMKAFAELVNHKNFDSSKCNEFGEPLLQALMYVYRCEVIESGKENKEIRSMIESILNSTSYNFNSLGLNLDSPIMVAVERPCTNWILDILIQKEDVEMNFVNDFNWTALGNAMRCGNEYAIKKLLTRSDIKITDSDREVARKHSINLDAYIEEAKKMACTTTVVNDAETKIDANAYAEIFANTFAFRK